MGRAYAALLHYPVKDRDGAVVTTAVTNLDVHDIARSARSYGLAGYFVVTPIAAQRELVDKILEHWRSGSGASRVPERGEALKLVNLAHSLSEVIARVEATEGRRPRVVLTAAKPLNGAPLRTHAEERRTIASLEQPTVIVFGTGHGLDVSITAEADAGLAPIQPSSDYNHLSVRAAAAIYFDRLFGDALDVNE
ncbi:MAG: RNA methyltransferase [Polyangiales bacterium]|nr:RNA methyltransferase [Myxococcales bacterium]